MSINNGDKKKVGFQIDLSRSILNGVDTGQCLIDTYIYMEATHTVIAQRAFYIIKNKPNTMVLQTLHNIRFPSKNLSPLSIIQGVLCRPQFSAQTTEAKKVVHYFSNKVFFVTLGLFVPTF